MREINRAARALVDVARLSPLDPLFVAVAFRKAAAKLSGEHVPEPRGNRPIQRPVFHVGVAEPE